jgi:hypothetical protein
VQLPYGKSHSDVFNYSGWPTVVEGQAEVDFHLIYQGRLPAAGQSSTRAREKQDIRKVFHRQLMTLWGTQPFLSWFKNDASSERLPDRYARCGFRFLPLISQWFTAACALDILFLRRDGPGSLVRSGGDIDNRIKVLFDALRMPQTCDEVCGDLPASDENPFFCLLEDDKLITKVQVETNWLLTPPRENEHIHDVHLVIQVKTLVTGSARYEAAFQ